ncbi:MAG: hypothetical protein JOZ41_14940, partial [Chloroflexi bacterium]|nr:hypothetical protein [Chloroflexota bacterium]
LAEAHAIAGRSGDLIRYEPRETGDWDERAARLRTMKTAASSPADLQPSGTATAVAEERL